MGGLVSAGRYPDVFHGTRLAHVGTRRFTVPWWFRTSFRGCTVPGRLTWLHLDGVNYRADVWLDGHLVASRKRIVGTFRTFRLGVTDDLRSGVNTLAIEVQPVDFSSDLTLTWIDWNPKPPDRGMGLWHDVYLTTSGPVMVSAPQVLSTLPLPSLEPARLTVTADVTDAGTTGVDADVRATIGSIAVAQRVPLAPGQTKVVTFDPSDFPQLVLPHPRVWWPYGWGGQPLYRLRVTADVRGATSDQSTTSFGIRSVSTDFLPNGARRWLVNGRPLLVRGGGWAPDIFLREQPSRLRDELRYVRNLGLNTIRLEGKLESDRFFDLTDRLGILALPGWMCCDRWQFNRHWTREDWRVAGASMAGQAERLRNHPSVIAFLIGSDVTPRAPIAQMYLRTLRRERWPDPIVSSASDDDTPLFGPTGLKMTGPYDWVPPDYWYSRRAPGGAEGFNTETGPGASIPPLADLRRMLSAPELRDLWMHPHAFQYHAGIPGSHFATFRVFDQALAARLGAPASLSDWVRKAQLMNYEAERAEFEAFRAHIFHGSTGVIAWMLDNAWPSLHWNLFDWYLTPSGATFGTKEANRPLHVLYSYGDHSVEVVDETTAPDTNLRVRADVFGLAGGPVWSRTGRTSVLPGRAVSVLTIPTRPPGTETTYFVRLRLFTSGGALVDTNTYWLSTHPDVPDFSIHRWWYTPTKRFADLRALSKLPKVPVRTEACVVRTSDRPTTVRVRMTDRSQVPAVLVRAEVRSRGRALAPIFWNDNDVTLMPRERRSIAADLRGTPAGPLTVRVSGWNVPARNLPLETCA